MRLENGPIPQLDNSWYDPTPEDPGFVALVNAELSQLPALELEMDTWLNPAAVILDALPDDGTNALISTLDVVMLQLADYDETLNIAAIDSYQQNGTDQLVSLYQVLPGEVWAPVPGPANFLASAGNPPPVNPLTVQLFLMPYHSAYPTNVGDHFRVSVALAPGYTPPGGAAGVLVTAYPLQNGAPRAAFDLGRTDAAGNLDWDSYWEPVDAGGWTISLYATPTTGGMIAGPQISFNVGSAPPYYTLPPGDNGLTSGFSQFAPGHTPAAGGGLIVSVTLANNANPGSIVYHPGDYWTLHITGPANGAVVVTASLNGALLGSATLGNTDASGTFTTTGQVSASDIGAWVETYTVGGQNWQGSLSFLVQP